ncbi:uncharacterized protein [Anabrus simplex]|uniref:uncharacterized protein n=1 Tax=Anabrus simplex TaxID=316456 RepID=UPI0035A39958
MDSGSIPETLTSTEVVESALPSDAEDRHDQLNELLIERIRLFMTTHSLQLNMPRYLMEAEEVPLDTFLEEGRDKKKKKKKKGIVGIIALALMGKLLLLKGIGIKLVGLLAAKALLISKLALVLAVAALLLKVLSKAGAAAGGGGGGGGDGGDKTTYEIIKVPYIAHADGGHDHGGGGGGGGYGGGGGHHYDSSGGGGGHHYESSGGGGGGYGGGWGRSVQGDAHMLAYRAHISHDAHGTPSPKLI